MLHSVVLVIHEVTPSSAPETEKVLLQGPYVPRVKLRTWGKSEADKACTLPLNTHSVPRTEISEVKIPFFLSILFLVNSVRHFVYRPDRNY